MGRQPLRAKDNIYFPCPHPSTRLGARALTETLAQTGSLSCPLKWICHLCPVPLPPSPSWSHLPPSFLDTFQTFQQITMFASWPSGAQERLFVAHWDAAIPEKPGKKLGQCRHYEWHPVACGRMALWEQGAKLGLGTAQCPGATSCCFQDPMMHRCKLSQGQDLPQVSSWSWGAVTAPS